MSRNEKKGQEVGVIRMYFDVSVSSCITEISKENHASRVVKIVNHASR